jgi:hypothetical protein
MDDFCALFGGGEAGARRARTTLAQESGHGLLHAILFINPPRSELFPQGMYDSQNRKILCREGDLNTGYNGRWWEYQAECNTPGRIGLHHSLDEWHRIARIQRL